MVRADLFEDPVFLVVKDLRETTADTFSWVKSCTAHGVAPDCRPIDYSEFALVLRKALTENESVEQLFFEECAPSIMGLVCMLLSDQPTCKVKCLSFKNAKLNDRSVQELIKLFRINKSITSLDLSGIKLASYEDAVVPVNFLKSLLQDNVTLTSLALASNGIDYFHANALEEMLSVNHTLTTLDVSDNNHCGGLWQQIQFIESNKTLTAIDATRNELNHKQLSMLECVCRHNVWDKLNVKKYAAASGMMAAALPSVGEHTSVTDESEDAILRKRALSSVPEVRVSSAPAEHEVAYDGRDEVIDNSCCGKLSRWLGV